MFKKLFGQLQRIGKAIKEDKVYNLDPKLWYFAAGSTTTTIKQIEELDKVVK